MPRQRLEPSATQLRHARSLLANVPVSKRYDWATLQGEAFVDCMVELTEQGIPLSWLATELEIDPPTLYASTARRRKAIA